MTQAARLLQLLKDYRPHIIATNPSVESGAFMRDVRTRGETTVHRAAAFANEDTIQLLLDAGARIDAKDANGDSPLTWASWHLRPDFVLRMLLYGGFSIHHAAQWIPIFLERLSRVRERDHSDSIDVTIRRLHSLRTGPLGQ